MKTNGATIQPKRKEQLIKRTMKARSRNGQSAKQGLDSLHRISASQTPSVSTNSYFHQIHEKLRVFISALEEQCTRLERQLNAIINLSELHRFPHGNHNPPLNNRSKENAVQCMLKKEECKKKLITNFESVLNKINKLIPKFGNLKSSRRRNEGLRILNKMDVLRLRFQTCMKTKSEIDQQVTNLNNLLIQAKIEKTRFERIILTEELTFLMTKWNEAGNSCTEGSTVEHADNRPYRHMSQNT